MQVREVMSREVISVSRATTLRKLLNTFAKFHIFPLVPVVDGDNRLAGIVSFRNLINAFRPHEPEMLRNVPFVDEREADIFKEEFTKEIGDLVVVEDIMEKKFVSVQEDVSLQEAYNSMKLNLKEEVPVIDKTGKLVGMIGIFDIIREIFHQKGVI